MVYRKRHFTEFHSQKLLDAVGACRQAVIEATMNAPFGTEIDHACLALQMALDDMAGTLTGNKRHFINSSHSTHNNPVPPPPTLRTFQSGKWPPASPWNDRSKRINGEAEAAPTSPTAQTLQTTPDKVNSALLTEDQMRAGQN